MDSSRGQFTHTVTSYAQDDEFDSQEDSPNELSFHSPELQPVMTFPSIHRNRGSGPQSQPVDPASAIHYTSQESS